MKFNQKYNHDAFSAFLREDFLPEDYVEKEKDIADLSRCKIITSARELGHSPSLNVSVLEMTHAKETDPRVSIATDAFKILATFGYDKALVIFKNDESENYRFSYLTISLDLNEKNKVVAKYSNARRYSFYLGEGAKTKTPEQQLVKRGRVKDTADLLGRFSLEVVNKQFYLEIAKFFDDLVDKQDANLALPFQSDSTVRKNFAMRLIGRLMFCWFLKQKKSKDGALIPDELLSASAVKDGYYHATLEPLFFEILNTQIDERGIRSDVYDKVPYLNGGLFSPQHDDYYELDRATFTSRHINTLRVADVWFREFFALLETYNFTIDENTVFDQELSVDPEMLGRIFENLLAEINPETGSSERKRTGSYYTPRQVVEYMVDQSLIEYLKTATGIEKKRLVALVSYDLGDDEGNQLTTEENKKTVEAIEELKILDPACGSGAFPIGALQKIVWILQRIDPDCKLWLERKLEQVPELYRKKITDYFQNNPPDYIRKLDVIKDSIFGVDIQPIAVEMSRLRCFLTLVVESEINDTKKNRGIEPLPNLDFKFVCANTLVGLPKKGSNGLFEDHTGIEELSEIMSEYFSSSNQRKAEMRQRFTNAQKDILNKSLSNFGKATGELTLKLSLWDPFSNTASPWFDPEWMFGVEGGFDVVIANPPYVSHDKITDKKYFQDNYKSYSAFADLYCFFVERALTLQSVGGSLCYITSNSYLKADYGKPLRELLVDKNYILSITNIEGFQVFDAAIVNTAILIAQNKKAIAEPKCAVVNSPYIDDIPFDTFVKDKQFFYEQSDLHDKAWSLLPLDQLALRRKIETAGKTLEKYGAKIRMGIATGANEVFVIDGSTRSRLIAEDPKSAEVIKPVLGGRDIFRYRYQSADKFIILTANGIDVQKSYPAVFVYLDSFGDDFKKRGAQGQHWSNLRATAFLNDFKKEKIIWIELSDKGRFALCTEEIYLLNSAYFLIPPATLSTKFLLALLNSKLIEFYLGLIAETSGMGVTRWINNYVKEFPIPNTSASTQKRLVELVDEINALTNSSGYSDNEEKKAQALKCEIEIDQTVYQLYNLTSEEISIVEKKA